jgi:hypothetical protein
MKCSDPDHVFCGSAYTLILPAYGCLALRGATTRETLIVFLKWCLRFCKIEGHPQSDTIHAVLSLNGSM